MAWGALLRRIPTLGLSLALFACTISPPALAETIVGKVVKIQDGDTLTVLDGKRERRIRLSGIDAPERKQPFYSRSGQALATLAFGKVVIVDFHKIDRYGRPVGKVLLNGRDLNLEQVRLGLAWHYKYYEKEQSAEDRLAYAGAQLEARARHAGLWADRQPIPPWDWREAGKKKREGAP